jgi:hypothetical protein
VRGPALRQVLRPMHGGSWLEGDDLVLDRQPRLASFGTELGTTFCP